MFQTLRSIRYIQIGQLIFLTLNALHLVNVLMAGTSLAVFCGYGHHISSRSLDFVYHVVFWVNRNGETPLQDFRYWLFML